MPFSAMNSSESEFIYTENDVLEMLDHLLTERESDWWNGFYEDREKPCPFFSEWPDESLANWVEEGLIQPGKALDLGCGNGRNSVFLARRGFEVEGVDYSRKAIDWAGERIGKAGVSVGLRCQSVFDLEVRTGGFDLVYDSGCFHHIPPHRRRGFVGLVGRVLKPGGWFGLTCFRPEGGSGFTDYEVYDRKSMGGGLGYTEESLRRIWSDDLKIHTLRQMQKPEGDLFGEDFLWVLLAQKSF
ncbi:MAG: class I SAM-dependent methyltransferase [Pyrinomonadaceae bacterium]